MLRRQKVGLGVVATAVVLLWFLIPVYGFFSHQKGWPMPPWGFQSLPDELPASAQWRDERYRAVSAEALARLERHRKAIRAPGISAAVAVEGQLVWTGVSGWADIKNRVEVTPDTRFRIGSTAKALTATAAARLHQEGELPLDWPIGEYPLSLPNPQWRALTVRQLASHMAGLPEYKENRDWLGLYHTLALKERFPSVQTSLSVFDDNELLYAPGSRFHYTTFHTVLLSAVLEAAGGEPYRELMQRQVFDPLQMHATMPEPEHPTADMASFYWRDGERLRPWRKVDLSHRLAGGGFVSTPSDLVKLGSAWLDDTYIHRPVRKRFWQPQRLNNGAVNRQNYALGWRIHPADDYMAMNANHGGVSRGAQCWLMVIPEYRMSVAVVINSRTEAFWDFGEVAVVLAKLFHASGT